MRIAFVWDWDSEDSQTITWQDGLSAALQELRNRGHDVKVITCGEDRIVKNPYHDVFVTNDVPDVVREYKPDVILCWGDTTRPNAKPLSELEIPMALCFAGGNPLGETYPYFSHIFVESQIYKDSYDKESIPCSIAFGTNTDLFQPIKQTKVFDTIFPATFALWKRHNLYAQATNGLRSLACGYMYESHEQECWQTCLNNGVTVLPHTSAQVLKYLYAASRVCVVPSRSDGGSQRTVLEAMAMNLPLIVCDSDKFDYVNEQQVLRVEPNVDAIRNGVYSTLNAEVNTRDFVVNNWSHIQYADALEAELNKIV